MAFYSGRLDGSGEEIKTIRQTYRKAIHDCSDKNMILSNRSSRFKTVRNVNSATLIEKEHSSVNEARKSEDSQDSEDNASLQFDFSINKGNDTFPGLELRSGDSFPSSNNLSYSYRKICEAAKLIQKPDAFREWLDAKKSAKTMEIMKRKYELQRINDEKAQRENEAKAKYNEWLSNKMKAQVENKRKHLQSKQNDFLVCEESSFIDFRGKERNYQAWLEKKLRQEKAQKEKLRTEIMQQKKYENLKKQKASAIFEDWLKKAPLKPKPVPLNRGIYSLKGSLSKMYVNPNPWVNIDEHHGNSSN